MTDLVCERCGEQLHDNDRSRVSDEFCSYACQQSWHALQVGARDPLDDYQWYRDVRNGRL